MSDKLLISKELYEKETIFAAAYSVIDMCLVDIRPADDRTVEVIFTQKSSRDYEFNKIRIRFNEKLIDEQLRRDLEKEFGQIRNLIVKHAFEPVANLGEKVQEIDR